jgi:dUTP pyrophosphatase
LPKDYEGQIGPRSGLAIKHGITVLNSPGTIDSGYTGEIKIILINHGKNPYIIKDGYKIAQIVFAKLNFFNLIQINQINFDSTDRKEKSFGFSDN